MDPSLVTEVNLHYRFYEQEFPAVHDLVVVRVTRIDEMGVYVDLLEYGDRQGMFLPSEVTRKKARALTQHIRVGNIEYAVVLRVDSEKGYIDLSKRRVTKDDIAECEMKYFKGRNAHNIFIYVAQINKVDLKIVLEQFGWPLYRMFGHAFDAFTSFLQGKEVFEQLLQEHPDIPLPWIESAKDRIRKVMAAQPVKVRTDFELTCTTLEGIDAIKAALRAGTTCTTELEIETKLVAPPLYVMSIVSQNRDKALGILRAALEVVRSEILSHGGKLVVKFEPRVVSQSDDRILASLMLKAEEDNKEVSGDQDEDAE
ncbi:hypothetical protein RCL1_003769 [Eukaryota sp. TZLM3-RCL]